MKVLLDIKDDIAAFILKLLQKFKFVKAKPLTPQSTEVLEGIKEAVDEVNQVKAGKKKAQPLSEFLDEVSVQHHNPLPERSLKSFKIPFL
ncbi:MAG: hypothetical protein K9I85_15620 [Saprospiraceae bacterium]|nr:hypothetical protein [Saprospiraceae bacterium]